MSFREKLVHELRAVCLTTFYFATCAAVLVIIKKLVLDEYHIEFHGIGLALLGALVVAKVVLAMEHVPLGSWVRNRPAMFELILRTALYAVGAFLALILEKAFEARGECGGFGQSLVRVFQHPDMPHVFANAICVACALLGFNVLSILRRQFGGRALVDCFFRVTPDGKGPEAPAGPGSPVLR